MLTKFFCRYIRLTYTNYATADSVAGAETSKVVAEFEVTSDMNALIKTLRNKYDRAERLLRESESTLAEHSKIDMKALGFVTKNKQPHLIIFTPLRIAHLNKHNITGYVRQRLIS